MMMRSIDCLFVHVSLGFACAYSFLARYEVQKVMQQIITAKYRTRSRIPVRRAKGDERRTPPTGRIRPFQAPSNQPKPEQGCGLQSQASQKYDEPVKAMSPVGLSLPIEMPPYYLYGHVYILYGLESGVDGRLSTVCQYDLLRLLKGKRRLCLLEPGGLIAIFSCSGVEVAARERHATHLSGVATLSGFEADIELPNLGCF